MDAAQEVKDRHRFMWSLGDYAALARRLEPAAAAVADATGVSEGTKVLDVGAGTGNFAVQAARRGANVIASDLTPHLIEIGKAATEAEGLDIAWQEADAENLPFEDNSFDVVASVFGAMFAPNAERAVDEMLRVTKPGGVVGFTSWSGEGYVGQTFALGAKYTPPPPEGVSTPADWADETAVRARFERSADSVEITREIVTFDYESAEEARESMEEKTPPMAAAKMFMPPETFEEFVTAHRKLRSQHDRGTGGRVTIDAEYFLVLARKS